MTVTSNIHVNIAGWSNATYAVGDRRSNAGNAYQCISAGTSTAPPSGTGSSINNGGTAVWKYLTAVDYTLLQDWANGIPTTLTQPVVGLVWMDATVAVTSGVTLLTLSGHTTSSTNTITLACAAGEGFRDVHTAAPTTPFAYSTTAGFRISLPASGVGSVNYFEIDDNYVILDGLQIRDPNASSGSTIIGGSGSNVTIRKCIIDGYAQSGGASIIQMSGTAPTITNSLLVNRSTTSDVPYFMSGLGAVLANDTIVGTAVVAGRRALDASNNSTTGSNTVKNCIFINYDVPYGAVSGTPWATSYNAYTAASFDISNNGTDGGNSIYGISTSATFVNYPTDFLAKAGASILNAGVTDTTDIPSADDVFGVSRPQGVAWDIGAHERATGSAVLRDHAIVLAISASPPPRDITASVDWLYSMSQTHAARVDFAGSLAGVAFQPQIEIKQSLPYLPNPFSSDFSSDFGVGPYTIDPSFPIEWAQRAGLPTRDFPVAIEWRGTASRDQIAPAEWRVSVVADRIVPTFWIAPAQADQTVAIGSMAGLSADMAVPLAAGRTILRDLPVQTEWQVLAGLTVSYPVGLEWGQSLTASTTAAVEWLIPTVKEDAVVALEFQSAATAIAVGSLDLGATLQADRRTSTEWGRAVLADAQAPAEFLVSARLDRAASVDFSSRLNVDAMTPAEFLSSQVASVPGPLEFGGAVFAAYAPQIAILGSPLVDWSVAIEVGGGTRSDVRMPIEVGGSLVVSSTALLDIGRSAMADASMPIEASHLTRSVSGDIRFTLEFTSAVVADAAISLDVDLGRQAIGSQLTPDEWERENAAPSLDSWERN